MKRSFLIVLGIFIANLVFSQVQNPVKWSYAAKKLNATTYEVHLTASIDPHWHLYSQTTPEGGPIATAISFTKNPLTTLDGGITEVGKLEKRMEPLFGVEVKQFSNKVDFVQVVKLRSLVKTTVTGSVEFMTCDDHQCLPPSTQKFSIALK